MKQVLKNVLANIQYYLGKIGRRIVRIRQNKHPVLEVITDLLTREGAVIIQIGAYVGDTENDPIYKCLKNLNRIECKLLLIEPVKEYFEKLKCNYGKLEGVYFENSAISNYSGIGLFYRINKNPEDFGFPEWLKQVGSLKKERIGKMWMEYEKNTVYQKFLEDNTIIEKINCLTFEDVCRKYSIDTVDLLQIDAEGSENEILSSVNFTNIKPKVINYECVLLGDAKKNLEEKLIFQGYQLIDYGQDTFAVLKDKLR